MSAKKLPKKKKLEYPKLENKDNNMVEEQHPFEVAINDFVDGIESMESSMFDILMNSLEKEYKRKLTHFKSFTSKKTKKNSDGKTIIQIESFSEFQEKHRAVRQAALALDNLPKSTFVMLVSHLDNHFKRNLKIVLNYRKELIDNTQKNISISELFELESMDEAKEYVLDREVEDILSTRSKYISWLNSKLNIDIRFDERIFARLEEITERRNLFVHAEGYITPRYVDTCKKNQIPFENKTGNKLEVSGKYFILSFMIIYLVGVISTHIIWRQLKPDEVQKSDEELNEKIVELLNRKRPAIALELAKFANSLSVHFSEEQRLIFIINEALCLKFIGNRQESRKVVESIDWSATKLEFQLAVAIIKDKSKEAVVLMHKIGANKNMKISYQDWPLFMKFRKTKSFVCAYKEIYNEDYLTTRVESVGNVT